MSQRSSRGGADVVSEVLPDGAFDKLSSGIWKLGCLLAPDELDNPSAPSTVRPNTQRVGNLALELSFDFEINDITEAAESTVYAATISEVELYAPIDGSELWSWRHFNLDILDEDVTFSRGASIVTPNGEIQLRNEPPIPLVHSRKKTADKAWEPTQRLAGTCTVDDYWWFMEKSASMAEDLRQGSD